MRKENLVLLALFTLAALMAVGFAATGPVLQVTDQSVVPSAVYPGTAGYLRLTLANNGDTIATGVTAHASPSGDASGAVYSGDITPSSSAQLTIPFKIPQDYAGGIWLLRVDADYNYQSGSGTASRTVSISVPIQVSQQSPLVVDTVSAGGAALAPGEKVTLDIGITNTGGVVNDLLITMPQNSSFSLDGATQKSVGSIPDNTTQRIALTLLASSSTPAGLYNVPVVFTYADALQNPVEKTLYIGPVSVSEASSQYRIYFEPITPTEIGTPAVFLLTVQNMGANAVSAVVDMNSTDVFTPIGMQRIYFDVIPAGGNASRNVTLGISASKSTGYYSMPLKLTPSSGLPIVYNTGIVVEATPEITVNLGSPSASGQTQVQVANTGSTQVRSVYVSVWPDNAAKAPVTENFIGTLSVDDFATVEMASTGGAAQVHVQVRFRDSNNIEHTIDQDLDSAGGALIAANGGTSGGFTGRNSTFAGRGGANNPLALLFGGASSGPNWTLIAIVLVVVAVVAYIVYTRYWKKRHLISWKLGPISLGGKGKEPEAAGVKGRANEKH
jgi:hypothetical protein